MVRLARRLWRAGLAAALAELRRSWPDVERAALAVAIRRAALTGAHVTAAARVATTIERSYRRQLAGAGLDLPAGKDEHQRSVAWALEVERLFLAALIGGRADDVRADAALSLLGVVLGAARSAVTVGLDVEEGIQRVGQAAGRAVAGVVRSARGAALRFAAGTNQRLQLASGVTQYVWTTQRDSHVRPGHRRLHGTVQDWSKPPIVAPGRRAHPGEDFGCRCWAEPVV